MSESGERYAVEDGVSVIELRLNAVEQLFNSLDPSPFLEKDLDADAEEYIVGAVDDFPLSAPLKLAVYLPSAHMTVEAGGAIGEGVRNYFAYAAEVSRRRLRQNFREARTSLVIGLGFLVFCVMLRELVLTLGPGALRTILAEGLLISGWVAMWRPVQLFLYGWWPLRHACLVHLKLARMPVEVRAETGPPRPGHG